MGTPQEQNDQDHADRGEAPVTERQEPACINCKFCRPRYSPHEDPYECRINPPLPAADDDQMWGIWPPVALSDWCGCHQPKPTPWPNV
jgi:hypothetical protein